MNFKITTKVIILGLLSLMTQGCSSTSQEDPMKIGTGRDDLKASVCKNCENSTPFYKDGQWLEER